MFQVGDKIVYPFHGAGVIEAIEEKDILGVKQTYYVINIRNIQLMFPMNYKTGVRPIVDSDILEDVFANFNDSILDSTIKPTQRYRNNMNKMRSGNIYQGTQVIRDLISLGRKRALAPGDKAMLENAQQILISEVILVKGITEEQANNLLNKVINN